MRGQQQETTDEVTTDEGQQKVATYELMRDEGTTEDDGRWAGVTRELRL